MITPLDSPLASLRSGVEQSIGDPE
jgi:hypothetical protein